MKPIDIWLVILLSNLRQGKIKSLSKDSKLYNENQQIINNLKNGQQFIFANYKGEKIYILNSNNKYYKITLLNQTVGYLLEDDIKELLH
jgi:co-chaperonin GroES (HSP10)